MKAPPPGGGVATVRLRPLYLDIKSGLWGPFKGFRTVSGVFAPHPQENPINAPFPIKIPTHDDSSHLMFRMSSWKYRHTSVLNFFFEHYLLSLAAV